MSTNLSELQSLTNWSPNDKHVDQKIVDGVSVSSGNILFCVGPSRLADVTSGTSGFLGGVVNNITNRNPANIKAIGTIASISINQSRPSRIVTEIGSKLHYNIPANVSGSIGMSRIFLNGKSLMKALYSFRDIDSIKDRYPDADKPGEWDDALWINMASTLFDEPIGIMMWVKDNKSSNLGSYYFENCNPQGLNFAIHSAGSAFAESTSFIFDRAVPVKVNI